MIPSESDPIPALVRKIHDAGVSMALVATGGGSRAISELLEVPGASRSVLEAAVPYAAPALVRYLGFTPTQFCSAATARAMAMAAFQRARSFSTNDPLQLAGVSCTASLASDRPKRGPHRMFVALQTARLTAVWTLELMKGARSRAEEELVASQLVLNAVATAASIGEQLSTSLVEGEAVTVDRSIAQPEWTDLLLGKCDVVLAHEPDTRRAIFPGAFNPPHVGHFRMAEIAADQLVAPVAFEISIENVDKPPLDFCDIEYRLDQIADRPVWLTRAPTFVTKAQLFPGATFVVGADTLERIGHPRYYSDDTTRMLGAIDTITACGCRFLAFGRVVGDRFQSLADLNIPPTLRAISQEVPPEIFRLDISSTELRRDASKADPP